MNYIQETIKDLESRMRKARVQIVLYEQCKALLVDLVEEPETSLDNSREGEPSEPIQHSRSGFVGVYPVGKNSKKWYASVTEKGKTKRLCGTHDTAQEANTARSEYLSKRDGPPEEQLGRGLAEGERVRMPRRVIETSNDRAV